MTQFALWTKKLTSLNTPFAEMLTRDEDKLCTSTTIVISIICDKHIWRHVEEDLYLEEE